MKRFIYDIYFVYEGPTVCPRSLDSIHIVTYYIKWFKTSWTDRNFCLWHIEKTSRTSNDTFFIVYALYKNGQDFLDNDIIYKLNLFMHESECGCATVEVKVVDHSRTFNIQNFCLGMMWIYQFSKFEIYVPEYLF